MIESFSCEQSGDVTSARFADETQVVLFSSHSGEVLMCGVIEWENLMYEPSDSVSELKATLRGLGLQIL
ncbi:MAG: hypothetical protein ABTQ25_20660 [Nitrosomonas ureae]